MLSMYRSFASSNVLGLYVYILRYRNILGTMNIVTLITFPLAYYALGQQLNWIVFATVGAVLSGAIYGDCCFPFSDTTICALISSVMTIWITLLRKSLMRHLRNSGYHRIPSRADLITMVSHSLNRIRYIVSWESSKRMQSN